MRYLLTLSCFLLAFTAQPDQSKSFFVNPSFEDTPRASKSPAGWSHVSDGSTPDIMPGAWDIPFPPQHGKSCVGLVTREDGSCEDIGQTLVIPLESGSCYTFSIWLAHATRYVGYDAPVRLRVWGGATPGTKTMLLASSPLISHTDWQQYKLQFTAKQSLRHITIEAYYGPGMFKPYKGNILIDNCSPIEKCDRA
jgi:hypothetical protein